jgi:hypothetical protein
MSEAIDTGLKGNRMEGAEMEAHTASIEIGIETGISAKPRRSRLAELRTALRERRRQRAERAYSLRANQTELRSIQGSEHMHLIRRPRGF